MAASHTLLLHFLYMMAHFFAALNHDYIKGTCAINSIVVDVIIVLG